MDKLANSLNAAIHINVTFEVKKNLEVQKRLIRTGQITAKDAIDKKASDEFSSELMRIRDEERQKRY
jgi:hypothetical protein